MFQLRKCYFVFLCIVVCVFTTDGQNDAEAVSSLCDKDNFYGCLCTEITGFNTYYYALEVDCSSRNVSRLSDDMLLPLFAESLSFATNELTEISYIVGVLDSLSLQSLLLNRNRISRISPDSFQGLSNLKTLDLSENDLSVIEPSSFHGIYKLRNLYLQMNKFTVLPQYAFQHLPLLTLLHVGRNNIGPSLLNLTDIFSSSGLSINPKIETLSLECINITDLPIRFFDSAYNLRELDLSMNPINTFPKLPYTLESLDISGARISKLSPRDFLELPSMRILSLNDMSNLTSIDDYTFHPMKKLNHIVIQNCKKLQRFSPFIFGVNAVTEDTEEFKFPVVSINFMGSSLKTLDEKLNPLMKQLLHLDIRSLPLQCDCKIKWMLNLEMEDNLKDNVRCASPPHLSNTRLWSLKPEQLECKTWTTFIGGVTRTVLVILCLLLAVLAVWLVILWPRKSRGGMKPVGPESPYALVNIPLDEEHSRV